MAWMDGHLTAIYSWLTAFAALHPAGVLLLAAPAPWQREQWGFVCHSSTPPVSSPTGDTPAGGVWQTKRAARVLRVRAASPKPSLHPIHPRSHHR